MCLLNSKNGFCLECVILWLVSGIHRINNAEARVEAFSLPSIDIKLEKNVSPFPSFPDSGVFSFPRSQSQIRKNVSSYIMMPSNYDFFQVTYLVSTGLSTAVRGY